MKKIGLDVRMIHHSGIGTTIRGLLSHLSPFQLKQLTLFGPTGWKNPYDCEFIPVRHEIYSLSQHWAYASTLSHRLLTLFHMPHFDVPYFYSRPFVATIHDLTHILFPEFSNKAFSDVYARICLSHIAKKARTIMVVSQNTKNDFLNRYPHAEKKVVVNYPGVGSEFRPVEKEEVRSIAAKYKLPDNYFLYVGNLRGNKNIDGLIKAYRLFKQTNKLNGKGPMLVLVGKNTLAHFKKGFPQGVFHLEAVPFNDLPAIYTGAFTFLFPSFYEGFGLPPLEAMACGAPVICSNRASLPEVCGEAAYPINPSKPEELAEAMTLFTKQESKRKEFREAGFKNIKRFSWTRFAETTWQVYRPFLMEEGTS